MEHAYVKKKENFYILPKLLASSAAIKILKVF